MAHVRHPTRGCGGPGQQHHSQSRYVEEQRYVCTTTHQEQRDAGLESSVEWGLSVVDAMWLAFVCLLSLAEACVLELAVSVGILTRRF